MFKTKEKSRSIPTVSDIQAIAQMPARMWGYAKIALIIWAAFWAAGFVVRIFGAVRAFRINREAMGDDVHTEQVRPTYALLNFNVYSGKKPGNNEDMPF